MTVGQRIKQLRKENQYTARTLGFLAQIHPQTIYNQESNRATPNFWHLQGYAKTFGMSLSEFFEGVE